MKFDFTLNSKKQIGKIPSYLEWATYHVTKHILLNNDSEQIGRLLDLEDDVLLNTRKTQLQQYKCLVSNENNTQPCLKCKFKNECLDLLAPITSQYYSIIKISIIEDNNHPRHVRYLNNKIKKNYITFITDSGFNIITMINLNKDLKIKTCFRHGLGHLNNFQLKLLKVSNDNRWHLKASMNKWKKRLSKAPYSNIKYHIEENWMWV